MGAMCDGYVGQSGELRTAGMTQPHRSSSRRQRWGRAHPPQQHRHNPPAQHPTSGHTYLRVPFGQKEQAKRLGARRDARHKLWYLPSTVADVVWREATSRWSTVEVTERPMNATSEAELGRSPAGLTRNGHTVPNNEDLTGGSSSEDDIGAEARARYARSIRPVRAAGFINDIAIYRGRVARYEGDEQRFRYYAVRRGMQLGIYTNLSGAMTYRPKRMQGFDSLADAYRYVGGKGQPRHVTWLDSEPEFGQTLPIELYCSEPSRDRRQSIPVERSMQHIPVLQAPGLQMAPNTKTHSSTLLGGGGHDHNTWEAPVRHQDQFSRPLRRTHPSAAWQRTDGTPNRRTNADSHSRSARQDDTSIPRRMPPFAAHPSRNPWQQPPPPPTCPMLTSSDRRQIAMWRKQLLYSYNLQHGQQHNPALRLSVHPSVWAIISRQLLNTRDKTSIGSPPNHAAVECYLHGIGAYHGEHGRPGEVYCADPLAVYRSLKWPDVSTLSYVTAFDIYMSNWLAFTESLHDVDRVDDEDLVPILTRAIRPQWLQDTIVMKIANGKGPNLIGHATKWRKRAKQHLDTLISVVPGT